MRKVGPNPGEIGQREQLVLRIRECLRSASVKTDGGDESGARADKQAAERLIDELTMVCAPTMQHYARAFFDGSANECLREDVIIQMTVNLVRAVRDLSPSNGAYERRFNMCLQRDCLDAVRSIRRENDDPEVRAKDLPQYRIISVDAPTSTADGGDGEVTVGDIIADPLAEQAFHQLSSQCALEDEITVLDPARRQVVEMRLASVGWLEIAAACGISDKTAQKYFKEAATTILERVAPEAFDVVGSPKA